MLLLYILVPLSTIILHQHEKNHDVMGHYSLFTDFVLGSATRPMCTTNTKGNLTKWLSVSTLITVAGFEVLAQ